MDEGQTRLKDLAPFCHINGIKCLIALRPTTESRAIKGFDEPVTFLRLKGLR